MRGISRATFRWFNLLDRFFLINEGHVFGFVDQN